MTPEEAAAELNGNQYTKEVSKELRKLMKDAGLVAVYGASDNLMEFDGAIYDEIGAYNGATAYVDENGLVQNECVEGDGCPNWRQTGRTIEAVWAPEGYPGNPSWVIKTGIIPCASFDIMEDDELYCKGIVFRLADAGGNKEGHAAR
jgi:hypothetical protein